VFKFLESPFLILSPSPCPSLLCELVEGFGNVLKILDEMPVEVEEPNKRVDLCHVI